MSNILNLTQRQMCEKIAEAMRHSNLLSSGYTNLLTKLFYACFESPDLTTVSMDLTEFIGSIVNENMSLNEISCLNDTGVQGYAQTAQSVIFRFENVEYTNGNEFPDTIIECINPYETILGCFGSPIMDKVVAAGFNTIMEYLQSGFDFDTTFVEGDLVVYYSGVPTTLFHFVIDRDQGTIILSNFANEDIEKAMGILGCIAAGTSMICELCQCLADGVHDPAGLYAILRHYANSKFSEVSQFASQCIKCGRDTIQETLNAIIQLFRSSFTDYTEDEYGNIAWNISSTPVRFLFWQVAGSILLGSFQVLGTVLLYSGKVIGKVVGGLLTVGVSIIQSISSYVGTVTGTNPYVNDDAIDHCYHDPIGQGDNQYIGNLTLHDDVITALAAKNRCKIVTPCCTIYLYNYDRDNNTISWKIFANVDSNIPVLDIDVKVSTGVTPVNPHYKYESGMWCDGCVNFGVENSLSSTDRFYGFDCFRNKGYHYRILNGGDSSVILVDQYYSKDWKAWIKKILTDSDSTYPVAIKTNSADGSKWTSLWRVLRSNAIATLALAFCNPSFYANGGHTIDNNHQPWGVDIRPLFYYSAFTGAPGYKDIIRSIVDLAAVDHSHDRFLAVILNTLGLASIPNAWFPSSLTSYFNELTTLTNSGIAWSRTDTTYVPVSGSPEYLQDHTGIFEFLSIDPYAYVTPPEYDYKSIIYGALFAGTVIAVAVGGSMLVKNIMKKKISLWWENKGRNLLNEGEVFRNNFTVEEWKQLSPSDRRTYMTAWKRYNFKVKAYNKISNILGLESLDWINNWWNAYEPAPGIVSTGTVDLANPEGVEAMSEVIEAGGRANASLTDPSVYSDNANALIIYRLIAGKDPDSN